MTATKVGLVALALTSGCLRFGYDAADSQQPDASPHDAGSRTRDAAGGSNAGGSAARPAAGSGGSGAKGAAGASGASGSSSDAGKAGSSANDADAGPGIDVDQMLGDTGLRVNDILGFYSSPAWGEMVLQTHGDEIWGVYEHDGGTIIGQIASEGVFSGWWSQLPSRTGLDAGEVQFSWSQVNGTTIHLEGIWRYGASGAWLDNWDLDLVTDRSPPSSLTDVFDHPEAFRRHP